MSICRALPLDPQCPPQGYSDQERIYMVMHHVSNGQCNGMLWNLDIILDNLNHLASTLSIMALEWKDTIVQVTNIIQSMNNQHDRVKLSQLGCCKKCMSEYTTLELYNDSSFGLSDDFTGLSDDSSLDFSNNFTDSCDVNGLPDVYLPELKETASDSSSKPQVFTSYPLKRPEDHYVYSDPPKPFVSSKSSSSYSKERKKRVYTNKRPEGFFKNQQCLYQNNPDVNAIHKMVTERLSPKDFSTKKGINLFTQYLLSKGRQTYNSHDMRKIMDVCGLKSKAWSEKNFCIVGEKRYNSKGCPILECINPEDSTTRHQYQLHSEYFEYYHQNMSHLKAEVDFEADGKIQNLTWKTFY